MTTDTNSMAGATSAKAISTSDYAFAVTVRWEYEKVTYIVETPVDLAAAPRTAVMDLMREVLPRDEGGRVVNLYLIS